MRYDAHISKQFLFFGCVKSSSLEAGVGIKQKTDPLACWEMCFCFASCTIDTVLPEWAALAAFDAMAWRSCQWLRLLRRVRCRPFSFAP